LFSYICYPFRNLNFFSLSEHVADEKILSISLLSILLIPFHPALLLPLSQVVSISVFRMYLGSDDALLFQAVLEDL